MNGTTVTLADLVTRTLHELESPEERGARVVLAADIGASDTTISNATSQILSVNDLLEFGDEVMLVTAVTPNIVVSRGYYGTTPSAHTTTDLGVLNPRWYRFRVASGVVAGVTRLEALGIPFFNTASFTLTASRQLELPEETRDVLAVQYTDRSGAIHDMGGWSFYPDLPLATYPTGKAIQIPRRWVEADEIWVVTRVPYRWSSYPSAPDATSTVTVPEGCEDIPALYAAAWSISGREVSRTEIDRAEEWPASENARGGASAAIVRNKWQEFYRSLDELRRLEPARDPIARPYKSMPKRWRFR